MTPGAAPAETHIVQQLPLHPQLPRCNAAVRVVGVGSGGVEGVGYVKSQFTLLLLTRRHGEKSTVQAEEEWIRTGRRANQTKPTLSCHTDTLRVVRELQSLYLHRPLQGLLDVHALAHDGLVQFALKSQEVHVGLGLRDQLADLWHKCCRYILRLVSEPEQVGPPAILFSLP